MPELDDRRPSLAPATTAAAAPVWVRSRLDGGAAPPAPAVGGGGVGACPSAVMAVGAARRPTCRCTPGAGGTTSSILPEELLGELNERRMENPEFLRPIFGEVFFDFAEPACRPAGQPPPSHSTSWTAGTALLSDLLYETPATVFVWPPTAQQLGH